MRLAADASALVAESLRPRGIWLIAHHDLDLYVAEATRSEVIHEVGNRVDAMIRHGRFDVTERERVYGDIVALLTRRVTAVATADISHHEVEARDRIPRDPNDWPTVALALAMGIGIWAVDQDYFGCGVPVWTTQTLLTHVEAGRARTST